ncbi:MAG TPA: DMT family transporter [Mycobacteriales bacterium]|nr:DMT family transporter [Mycobacteriales bacterium]
MSNSPAAGRRSAALAAVVFGGALVGVQARINGELTTRVGSALTAAMLSFVTGTVPLLAALPAARGGIARLCRAPVRAWWFFGGLGGAALVAVTAHAVPRIGVALAGVCLVAGTTAGALAVDRVGLGPSGRHPATRWRLGGVAIVVAAVALGAIGETHRHIEPLLFVGLFAAGAAAAAQQAANGQLRVAADDTVVASLISFAGGSLALVLAAAIAGDINAGSWPGTWWLYLGGPLGTAYIAIGAVAVRVLGVLRFALGVVAGQLVMSVVLDASWPEPGASLRAVTVVAATLTVGGVWLSGRDTVDHPLADHGASDSNAGRSWR